MVDFDDVRAQGRRGEQLLRAGQYAEGFRLYDEAWRTVARGQWLDLPLPRWRGENLAGARFLISGEQGFGDQIMFARFAKLLQAYGAEVIWPCERPLSRLFSQCLGFHSEPPGGGPEAAYYCPSGQLPLHFFPPLTEPPSGPYLLTPPARPASGAKVGIVTRGDPKHAHDAVRSLPLDLAAELISSPRTVSLHPEDTGAADFHDTAAIIAGLDLVISVDTSVAHLAGAMGKPVWILLSSEWCDWRWMRDRHDSPWYPSARLFRQPTPGDWTSVVGEVLAGLRTLDVQA